MLNTEKVLELVARFVRWGNRPVDEVVRDWRLWCCIAFLEVACIIVLLLTWVMPKFVELRDLRAQQMVHQVFCVATVTADIPMFVFPPEGGQGVTLEPGQEITIAARYAADPRFYLAPDAQGSLYLVSSDFFAANDPDCINRVAIADYQNP